MTTPVRHRGPRTVAAVRAAQLPLLLDVAVFTASTLGLVVGLAVSIADARAQIAATSPDVVLLDHRLPEGEAPSVWPSWPRESRRRSRRRSCAASAARRPRAGCGAGPFRRSR
jgi:CheY-like chemotaxis protein